MHELGETLSGVDRLWALVSAVCRVGEARA